MPRQHEYCIANGQLRFEDGTCLTILNGLHEQLDYYHKPEPCPERYSATKRGNPDARRRFLFAGV